MKALMTGALLALTLPTGCASQPESQGSEAAPAVASERKAWDAEEMTALTGELAESVREVRRAWRREPTFRAPNTANRASMELDQRLRQLDRRTTQLHTRVKAGDGYEETLNIARNIRALLNDVDVLGRRIMTTKWMHDRVRPTMELLNQVAAFYGKDALFDPETLQRTDRPPRR